MAGWYVHVQDEGIPYTYTGSSWTSMMTLGGLTLSNQTGTASAPAVVGPTGGVTRDALGTLMQRGTGGFVAVRNTARQSGEFYEFWDPSAGWANLACGTIVARGIGGSTIRMATIGNNGVLGAVADAAAARTLIGAQHRNEAVNTTVIYPAPMLAISC